MVNFLSIQIEYPVIRDRVPEIPKDRRF